MSIERNYGVDLLRLLSMLYIVILHTLGHGGVLKTLEEGTIQYQICWFLEIWAYCAVNIFAVISGYVGFSEDKKQYKYSNYIVMWLQVVLYGALCVVMLQLINPELVTTEDLLDMFFPVTNNLYWYFTAYTGLFVLIPMINEALRQCSPEALKKTLVVFVLMFSVFECLTGRFTLNNGYSFAWLAILYVLGAGMRKCKIGKETSMMTAFVGIVLCCLVSWLWKLYGFEFELLNCRIDRDFFVSYVSPTHVCAAVFYVILFAKIQCAQSWKKVISFAAPGAFAVYLINDQIYIRKYVMKERFLYLAESPVHIIFLHILGVGFLFLIVSVTIDYVRRKMFGILRVKEIAEYIVESVNRAITYCTNTLL